MASRLGGIFSRLKRKSVNRLGDFFEDTSSKSEMVATFLAILELIKARKITVDGDGENSLVQKSGEIDNIDDFTLSAEGDNYSE